MPSFHRVVEVRQRTITLCNLQFSLSISNAHWCFEHMGGLPWSRTSRKTGALVRAAAVGYSQVTRGTLCNLSKKSTTVAVQYVDRIQFDLLKRPIA
jgi:hypothetical protein